MRIYRKFGCQNAILINGNQLGNTISVMTRANKKCDTDFQSTEERELRCWRERPWDEWTVAEWMNEQRKTKWTMNSMNWMNVMNSILRMRRLNHRQRIVGWRDGALGVEMIWSRRIQFIDIFLFPMSSGASERANEWASGRVNGPVLYASIS